MKKIVPGRVTVIFGEAYSEVFGGKWVTIDKQGRLPLAGLPQAADAGSGLRTGCGAGTQGSGAAHPRFNGR